MNTRKTDRKKEIPYNIGDITLMTIHGLIVLGVAVVLTIFAAPICARAAVIVGPGDDVFIPSAVGPGDTYQLTFVTRDFVTASQTDIGFYDSFVQSQAALNPTLTGTGVGVTWSALVATTSATDVRANASIIGPVYDWSGFVIAANSADMFDGTLGRGITEDQFDVLGEGTTTWTGFDELGSPNSPLGGVSAGYGAFGSSTSTWANLGIGSTGTPRNVYALSEPITLIPEPTTLALLPIAGVVLAARRRRK